MISLIHLEFCKLKRKHLWLCVLFLLLFQFAWSLWAASSHHPTDDGWRYLLYQMPAINSLLMPILISILASRISDNEHKGNTFMQLRTLTSPTKLYMAKFICVSLYLVASALGQVICMLLTSYIVGFTEAFPLRDVLLFFMTTLTVNFCLLALYQGIALVMVNQVIVLVGGLIGGFLGVFSLFFPPIVQYLCLPAYYSILDTIYPIMDIEAKTFSMSYDTLHLPSLYIIIIAAVFLFIIGQISFSRKEL